MARQPPRSHESRFAPALKMSGPDEKPAQQRPELPDFWDHRFRSGTTPWEMGKVPPALQEFARAYRQPCSASPPSGRPRIIVPGCGSAWDAAFLDQSGWDVTALDFSPAAIDAARATLGDKWHGNLLCADFFAFDFGSAFDVVYERAFLCALPRSLWPGYAVRMARLLRPGGQLAGFFFLGDELKGPPFGIRPEQLDELLTPYFTRRDDQPVEDSLPVFAKRERWQVWQRS